MNKALILLLSITMSAISFSCRMKEVTEAPQENSKETSVSTNDLPTMMGIGLDSSRVNLREVSGKIILILFQPDCDHCQREATQIHDHLDSFKDYSLYFITTYPFSHIEKFAVDYGLKNDSQVYFLQTSVESIISNFGNVPAPSLYIYSADKKLVRGFNGETKIDDIIKSL